MTPAHRDHDMDNAITGNGSGSEYQHPDILVAELEERAPQAWDRYTHGLPPHDDLDARLYREFAAGDEERAQLLLDEREQAALDREHMGILNGELELYAQDMKARAQRAPEAWDRYTHGLPPHDDLDAGLYREFAVRDEDRAWALLNQREQAAPGLAAPAETPGAARHGPGPRPFNHPAQLASKSFGGLQASGTTQPAGTLPEPPPRLATTRPAARAPGQPGKGR